MTVILLGSFYFLFLHQGIQPALTILLEQSMYNNDFAVLNVIAATIPFAGAFYQDWHSGNFQLQIVRSGKNKYGISKIVVCSLSGGMVSVLGRIILLFYGYFNGYPIFPEGYSIEGDVFWRDYFLEDGQIILFFMAAFLSCFMVGAVWAMMGLCLSVYISNPFVIYFLPYVLLLLEKILPKEIPQWMFLSWVWIGWSVTKGLINNLIYTITLPMFYLMVLATLFIIGVKRRSYQ